MNDDFPEDEPTDNDEPQDPNLIFFWATLFELGIGIVALLAGWLIGPDARALLLEWTASNATAILIQIAIGCAAAIPMLGIIELISRLNWEPMRELDRISNVLVQPLLQLTAIELILLSVCAGVGEELLLRGWLMHWIAGSTEIMSQSVVSIAAAVIGSSVIFGLIHPITKMYVALATLMGFYFAFLLIISGNLLVPIAAHACYDAILLILAKKKSALDGEG